MHRFASFLSRAGMAPALDFGPDPSDPSASSSSTSPSSSSSTPSAPTNPSSRRLLLIEDLPNVSHYTTKLALRSALAQYLSSPRVTAPLVLIVSEALARPGDDEAGGGGGGWLSGNGRRGESVDARGVCGVEVLEHPACREIACVGPSSLVDCRSLVTPRRGRRGTDRLGCRTDALPPRSFNPVAPTIMRKALVRTLDRLYSPSSSSSSSSTALASRPTLATLDVLVAHSGGDMRSALMSLEFLLTEGEGPGATSLGGGAAAAGGKGGKGKGKKRKRKGESSDEEDGAGGRGKGKVGKEGVKKLCVALPFRLARSVSRSHAQAASEAPRLRPPLSRRLQFVTARESSLFIFHALGKVLYNKRASLSPSLSPSPTSLPGLADAAAPARPQAGATRPTTTRRTATASASCRSATTRLDCPSTCATSGSADRARSTRTCVGLCSPFPRRCSASPRTGAAARCWSTKTDALALCRSCSPRRRSTPTSSCRTFTTTTRRSRTRSTSARVSSTRSVRPTSS